MGMSYLHVNLIQVGLIPMIEERPTEEKGESLGKNKQNFLTQLKMKTNVKTHQRSTSFSGGLKREAIRTQSHLGTIFCCSGRKHAQAQLVAYLLPYR